ncbi:MAG: DNA repair protein RadA [Candidatus Neomarinimicrobiota bacterium]|nr:DNA repair protein RadA [Candidatus Neomarinimicrobiota bacterium]
MAKVSSKTIFLCSECGNEFSKWHGKCPACDEWGTLKDYTPPPASARTSLRRGSSPIMPLEEILTNGKFERAATGIGEVDRVLGGGLLKGTVVLLGGNPGIGKSTLALQTTAALDGSTLYVSAEESGEQIALRARRLDAAGDKISITSENCWEAIDRQIRKVRPDHIVIDSIQTIFAESGEALPGAISQVRECGQKILDVCKSRGVSAIIIGHVTKEGVIAGPRMLEHMVDTVLYLEGDSRHDYRLLRAVKNRFGSTNEVGVFEMTGEGMKAVENPSEMFLAERHSHAAGCAVFPSMEGSRPILVEVQALASNASYGTPQRNVTGIDLRRLSMLTAVLEKRVGVPIGTSDVFVNIVGGMRIDEPAADMAVIAAVASSKKDQPVPADVVLMGEVGLAGELRSIAGIENRLKEAKRLGFKRAVVPRKGTKKLSGIAQIKCSTVNEVFEAIF